MVGVWRRCGGGVFVKPYKISTTSDSSNTLCVRIVLRGGEGSPTLSPTPNFLRTM